MYYLYTRTKGDLQNYTNYHDIKLMSHTIKLWKIVMEQRLRHLGCLIKWKDLFCQRALVLNVCQRKILMGHIDGPTIVNNDVQIRKLTKKGN